jgi:phosphosulfolactate phosphohydrolase-like enzyme
MLLNATVRIDALPESPLRYPNRTLVCIDVLSCSTHAVTAVAQGQRVFSVGDAKETARLGAAARGALVLADSPGTRLLKNCNGRADIYVACLRNLTATARFLAAAPREVVLLGAGEAADFRCEDKLAAARIGRLLVERGFTPVGQDTADLIERWSGTDVSIIGWGRSAEHLRRSGRADDLQFVLSHVDDLDLVCRFQEGEIVAVGAGARVAQHERAGTTASP